MSNSQKEKFGYCHDCINKGCCGRCYRGSYYERKDDER